MDGRVTAVVALVMSGRSVDTQRVKAVLDEADAVRGVHVSPGE